MPNYCSNEVTFSFNDHEPELFKRLVDIFASDEPFQQILPMPEILRRSASGGRNFEVGGEQVYVTSWYQEPAEGTEGSVERPWTPEELAQLKEIGSDSWYDWRVTHWGTKWDIDPQPVDECNEFDELRFSFDTAWSPPVGIYAALAQMIADKGSISWFYREDGQQLAGWL